MVSLTFLNKINPFTLHRDHVNYVNYVKLQCSKWEVISTNIVLLGIPTDGCKARPDAKPVGFTVYLSNFFIFLFGLHQYSLYLCTGDSFLFQWVCVFIWLSVYLINAITVNDVPIEEHKSVLEAFSQRPVRPPPPNK